MEMNWKTTWASKTAGICLIVAGILGITSGASIVAKGILLGAIGKGVESMVPFIEGWLESWPVVADIASKISGALGISALAMFAIGAILITLAAITLIGGLFALRRRRWRFAIASSILALPSSLPLSIVSIILVALSKDEFRRK